MSNPGAASTVTSSFVGGGDPIYVGTASTSLVGFYGQTPVDQPAAVATVTTTGATNTTLAWGYTTSTQANAVVSALNSVIARLRETGLIDT